MARKLRISIVEYLNTAPLVWGFTDGPLVGKYDLSFTVPSQCAEALRRGDVDVAIIPSIEYQRIDGLVVLPDMAVASEKEARSLLVVAKKPVEMARTFALDTSSRSTVALVKILSKRLWKIAPEFVDARPEPAEMLKKSDAALVIGDPALRVALKMSELSGKSPSADNCCSGDPEDMPVPGVDTLFVYDVVHQWREMTDKPAVLAIWAARRDAMTPEIVADFHASKAYGLERIRDISEGAGIKLDLAPVPLEQYLRQNIQFDLDEPKLDGLRLFYQYAAEEGLIPVARPIEFAEAPAAMGARGK
ncbi:MAG TPA: menaquinone biosynthesis protein [Candidatus Acidoferrum sp.]|jgi:chorismate dehydratase|nr:menaquinone biosynthesis protein [Candidatus Acidoferrum sp.]